MCVCVCVCVCAYIYIYIYSITKASGINTRVEMKIIDEVGCLERMGLRVQVQELALAYETLDHRSE